MTQVNLIGAWAVVILAACGPTNGVRLGDLPANPDAAEDPLDGRLDGDTGMPPREDARVDAEAPDAEDVADGGADADATAPDAFVDAAECGCGPESCGTRTCGRSVCGYPCGSCGLDRWCMRGTCQDGPGPGAPCRDAFDIDAVGSVGEGDIGFRACPGVPGQVQACTCTGGGADAWADCSGICFTPCVGDVGCSDETCGPLDFCEACADGFGGVSYTCRPRRDGYRACGGTAAFIITALCDGADDCAYGETCTVTPGDITDWLSCEPMRDGSICASDSERCDSDSDCGSCATECSALLFANGTESGLGLSTCQ